MFSKSKNRFLGLAVSIAFASAAQVHTVDAAVASINEANLPINVSNQETAKAVSEQNKPANALVSPSRAKAVANTAVQAGSAGQNNSVSAAGNTADAKVSGNSDANAPVSPAQNNAAVSSAAKNTSAAQPAVQAPLPQQNQAQAKEDFNFDLKMKSINAPTQQNANNAAPRLEEHLSMMPICRKISNIKQIRLKLWETAYCRKWTAICFPKCLKLKKVRHC